MATSKAPKRAATNEPRRKDKPQTEQTLRDAGPTTPMPDDQPQRGDGTDRLNTPGS